MGMITNRITQTQVEKKEEIVTISKFRLYLFTNYLVSMNFLLHDN